MESIEEYPQVSFLGKQVEEKMFTDPNLTSAPFNNNIYLGTMESWLDKFTFWFDVIMTPTAREFELLPLPKWLGILYYPIRLLRLTFKYSIIFISKSFASLRLGAINLKYHEDNR